MDGTTISTSTADRASCGRNLDAISARLRDFGNAAISGPLVSGEQVGGYQRLWKGERAAGSGQKASP